LNQDTSTNKRVVAVRQQLQADATQLQEEARQLQEEARQLQVEATQLQVEATQLQEEATQLQTELNETAETINENIKNIKKIDTFITFIEVGGKSTYKDLLINDIFFTNLNFFSYYAESDDSNMDIEGQEHTKNYDDINIEDIVDITETNQLGEKLTDKKQFDFIKLLERIKLEFIRMDIYRDEGFKFNSGWLFDWLFDGLTFFLDYTYPGTNEDIINRIIFDMIDCEKKPSSASTNDESYYGSQDTVSTILDEVSEVGGKNMTGGSKQEIFDLVNNITKENDNIEESNDHLTDLRKKLSERYGDNYQLEGYQVNFEVPTKDYMIFFANKCYDQLLSKRENLNENRKLKLYKTLAVFRKEIEKLKNVPAIYFRRITGDPNMFIEKKIQEIKEKMLDFLNPSLKVFEEQLKEIELQEKKEKDEQAKRQKESEIGGLGDKKIVQENFLTTVAKLGLFLNGFKPITDLATVTDEDILRLIPQINDPSDEVSRDLSLLEIKILNYYANGCPNKRPSYRDLDTALFDKFESITEQKKQDYIFNDSNYMCNKKKLYMIDNAAALNTKRRLNTVFCPLTSIVDGMGQCTLGSGGDYGANDIEIGNMNFSVQNSNLENPAYYKGRLDLSQRDNINPYKLDKFNHATYTINYKGFGHQPQFPPGIEPEVSTTIEIPIINAKIKDLEAHNALKRTLVKILKIIQDLYTSENPFANYLTSGGDVFNNIVNIITNPKIELTFLLEPRELDTNEQINGKALNNELLQAFFTILGKGAGDIFQEINSICKNGGYIGIPNYLSTNIMPWNEHDGNGVRFFAAKDRPSAARFMFLTWFGRDDQINISSAGGFISETKEVLVTRNEPFKDNFCGTFGHVGSIQPSAPSGGRGGSNKTKKSIIGAEILCTQNT
jgi:predicted  nucleic acid-binding Zn-ribbon protein